MWTLLVILFTDPTTAILSLKCTRKPHFIRLLAAKSHPHSARSHLWLQDMDSLVVDKGRGSGWVFFDSSLDRSWNWSEESPIRRFLWEKSFPGFSAIIFGGFFVHYVDFVRLPACSQLFYINSNAQDTDSLVGEKAPASALSDPSWDEDYQEEELDDLPPPPQNTVMVRALYDYTVRLFPSSF